MHKSKTRHIVERMSERLWECLAAKGDKTGCWSLGVKSALTGVSTIK